MSFDGYPRAAEAKEQLSRTSGHQIEQTHRDTRYLTKDVTGINDAKGS